MAKSKEERLWQFLRKFFYDELAMDDFENPNYEVRRVYDYVTKHYKNNGKE